MLLSNIINKDNYNYGRLGLFVRVNRYIFLKEHYA